MEDPRITEIDGVYYVVYTGFSEGGPLVCLATTRRLRDVRTSRRADVARGQGRGAVPTDLRRPMGPAAPARARARGPRRPRVALVEPGPALLGRGQRRAPGAPGRVVGREQGGRRAASPQDGAGMAALLPRCPHHGVGSPLPRRPRAAGPRRPLPRCSRGSDEWVLGPTEPYERSGDVPGVVFPNGWVLNPDDDTLRMYYGAADNVVAGASASLARMLGRLEAEPRGRTARDAGRGVRSRGRRPSRSCGPPRTPSATRDASSVALSGGSTPRSLYQRLGSPGYADDLDVGALHVFWGDERCVPPFDPDSDYRMAKETLLDHVRDTGGPHPPDPRRGPARPGRGGVRARPAPLVRRP